MMNKQEEWRDVVGYEGIYMVSDRGRVKRIARPSDATDSEPFTEHLLKPMINRQGRRQVCLCWENHKKLVRIYHLVAEAFIGPNDGVRTHINHKDGNYTNDVPENLEWCTIQENIAHAVRHGLNPFGERNGNTKLSREGVMSIISMAETGEFTLEEIADRHDCSVGSVCDILAGRTWTHIARPVTTRRGNDRESDSKLTREQVREIKRRYDEGDISQRALGDEFGVAHTTVGVITRGELYLWAWEDD